MNPPKVIGLCGAIGSGKSTVASLLRPHGYTVVHFAGPLKAMLRAIGLEDAQLNGSRKEEPSALLCGRTPRHAMQTLGNEWGRGHIDPDFWVNLWRINTLKLGSHNMRVVTDDLRYPNELAAIRSVGGAIWRVARREAEDAALLSPAHASEQHWRHFQYDLLLDNNGSPADLESSIARALVIHAG